MSNNPEITRADADAFLLANRRDGTFDEIVRWMQSQAAWKEWRAAAERLATATGGRDTDAASEAVQFLAELRKLREAIEAYIARGRAA